HAYDPRCMVIPVNVARLLNRAGYEFGILGEEECCCGNEIRRIGESGLFEELMEENKANFEEYGIKEIIALSPHCMNTMKNEYGDMGIKVMHYTEVLSNLIEDGSLKIEKPIEGGIIYHDPCFLGKQNNIFEQPRGILKTLNGAHIHEFARSREISLCCEGGGGRMFFDVEVPYQRNGEVRVLDAKKAGANTIATACPFCLMNLEDPAKEKDILVKDISEILSEVI
nr:(Fe-S)-binding protein [Syntrophorhabdaceae bacterium]